MSDSENEELPVAVALEQPRDGELLADLPSQPLWQTPRTCALLLPSLHETAPSRHCAAHFSFSTHAGAQPQQQAQARAAPQTTPVPVTLITGVLVCLFRRQQ